MKHLGILVVYLALAAGTFAQESPVSVRLAGSSNQQGFPVLDIHVARQDQNLGAIHVRFPETIEARQATNNRQLKFYQDIRSPEWPAQLECEPILPVQWSGDESHQSYTMALDNGMKLEARADFVKDRVELSYTLKNDTTIPLRDIRIWSCIQFQSIPELADPLMERTSILLEDRFVLLREQIPTFQAYPKEAATNHRFSGYMTGVKPPWKENPTILPHPGHPNDMAKAIYFWYVPKPIARPVIATTSRSGAWTVCTIAPDAPGVWTNPGISCHHADPVVDACEPGESVTVKNQLRLVRGNILASSAFELEGDDGD